MSISPSRRLLFVTPYPPTPPMGGGRRRQLEILRRLAGEFDVTLATVSFGTEDERALPEVVPPGVRIVSGRPLRGRLTRKLPLALQWSWSAELAGKIAEAHGAEPFQLALVSHTYAFHYVDQLDGLATVVDAQNVESRIYEQFSELPRSDRWRIRRLAGRSGAGFLGASRSARSISALERRVWGRAGAVACVSAEEQELIRVAAPAARTVVAPNCPSEVVAGVPPAPRDMTVSFCGSLNYIPNIDAVMALADRIAPRLRASVPDARIVVAGAEPARPLVRFCVRRGIEVIPSPSDMASVIAATVMACPVRLVAGTRLKILDARTLGVPVVTTSAAAEGLDLGKDPGVLVCEDPDAVAAGLISFLLADEWPPPLVTPGWDQALAPLVSLVNELAS